MRRLHGIAMMAFFLGVFAGTARGNDNRLWDTTGVVIRQGFQIEWQRAAEMDQDGNVVYTWSDTREGDRDVYAQKVSPSGQKLWPAQGALIVHELGRQEDPLVIPTGFGDYIFIWNDFRNDITKGDLYAQKVNANGQIQWSPATGKLLSTGDFDSPAEFRIVADGTGGAVILWNDLRSGDEGDIYAIRVDANGNIPAGWPTDGLPVVVAPAGQKQLTVDTDGAGGAIVAWKDSRNAPVTGDDIYIQRVTINAQLAWGTDGVVVCDTLGDQSSPKLCPNGSGGAYLVWEDKRADLATGSDLYFQVVSSTGALLLPFSQGKPLVTLAQEQIKPRIVADGSGNAIIVWQDTRNDPGNLFNDVYAMKVNSGGSRLWIPTDGVPVCVETADQSEVRVNADDAGGAVCAWMDERDGNESPKTNIYAQKINSNGSTAWTANGVPVCEAIGFQYWPLVRAAATYSLIAWGDDRSGSKGIWQQKLNAGGVPQLAVDGDTLIWGISGDARYPHLVQDHQGKILVFFQDVRNGPFTAYEQIVDTTGTVLLEPNGRRICPGSLGQESLDACSDGGTGAIVVWKDTRDTLLYNQVFAQRVASDGSLLWGTGGLQVSPYGNEQGAPLIAPDGSGGAIAAWSALSSLYDLDVYAAKIASNSSVPWSVQLTSIPYVDEAVEDIVPDGNGGAYFSYRGGAWEAGYDVYAQHIDASGNKLWGDGLPLSTEMGMQNNSRIAGLGLQGAIFIWEDGRDTTGLAIDLFAQKVSSAGQVLWAANGIPVVSVVADQSSPELALDNADHLFIVWQDFRNANFDLYVQKMTLDGQMLLAANGIPFSAAGNDQSAPRLLSDGGGGNYVFWDDYRSTSYADVFGTHLDSSATPYSDWATNGEPVSAYFHEQKNASPIGDYASGAVVLWEDKRSSGKDEVINLYAQRVNDFAVGVSPEAPNPAPPAAFRLYRPYPNPFNPDVRIRFEIAKAAHVRLAVYDPLGREVAILKNGWQARGPGEALWRAKDYSSGVYFVRLEFEGRQALQKLLLLK